MDDTCISLRREASDHTKTAIATWTEQALHSTNLTPDAYAAITRNRVAKPANKTILSSSGKVVWTFKEDDIIDQPCPSTVNPSLWRQAKVNSIAGLFKVVDGMYQIRGFDISQMTIVESQNGIIVIDPGFSCETVRAGIDLYFEHRGRRKVVAVMYSHSHVDHFQGVAGAITQKEVDDGHCQVIAPMGFEHHALREAFLAGNAMFRRSMFMFAVGMPTDDKGVFDRGLGAALSAGTPSFIRPTTSICQEPVEIRNVDGVEIHFQLVQDTEAPSEMNFYFPAHRVLDIAETAVHTMHNTLTPRGAEVRDPKLWAFQLNECLKLFGNRSDVLIMQHGYPVYGQEELVEFISDHRDMMRYMHDQSLRLINKGYLPLDIAEELLELPPGLAEKSYCRPYYGTTQITARAVYQRYLGIYDANPSSLNPVPPVQAAKKYVDLAGGLNNLLGKAKNAVEQDDLRWAAELLRHAVFAVPENTEGRHLLAEVYEQLGYRCENATWRSIYLRGATELRMTTQRSYTKINGKEYADSLHPNDAFDYLAVRLNGRKAADLGTISFIINFGEENDLASVLLRNGVLTAEMGRIDVWPAPNATLNMSRITLAEIAVGLKDLRDCIIGSTVTVAAGDSEDIEQLFELLEDFNALYPIVLPVNGVDAVGDSSPSSGVNGSKSAARAVLHPATAKRKANGHALHAKSAKVQRENGA